MLLFATVVLTGCRFVEHSRRAAVDAFASFVLDSVLRIQRSAPLTQGAPLRNAAAATAPQAQPQPRCTAAVLLPKPYSRLAHVSLAPAAPRIRPVAIADEVALKLAAAARVRVELRMARAELPACNFEREEGFRRIIFIADPAAL